MLTLDAGGSRGGGCLGWEQITSYTWDLNDDGTFETDTTSWYFQADYSYLESLGLGPGGPYDIHLRVTDDGGFSDTAGSTLTIIIPGDINRDGVVDLLDLDIFGQKHNKGLST